MQHCLFILAHRRSGSPGPAAAVDRVLAPHSHPHGHGHSHGGVEPFIASAGVGGGGGLWWVSRLGFWEWMVGWMAKAVVAGV